MKKYILDGVENVINKNKKRKLTFICLESSRLCPLQCLYCFEDAGKPDKNELSLKERKKVLDDAKKLGAKTMVVTGAGEPLVDPLMKKVISYAKKIGLKIFIYTCGWNIDQDFAKFLFEHDVSLAVKLESLRPEIHDAIVGRKGSHERVLRAIDNLLEAGYKNSKVQKNGDMVTRLEIATLVLKQNYKEILEISKWVAQKGIKYGVDELGLFQKARENKKIIDPGRKKYENAMRKVTQESLSKKGEACKLWQYGIIVSNTGDVKYCAEIPAYKSKVGNIRKESLSSLLKRKQIMYPARASSCASCILKVEARNECCGGCKK